MNNTIRYLVRDAVSGDTLFRTRDRTDERVGLLDRVNVQHGAIEKISLGYDPDDVRAKSGTRPSGGRMIGRPTAGRCP